MFVLVGIGTNNNKNTSIMKGSLGQQASTPGILDCNMDIQFWVEWTQGMIAIGRGSIIGVNTIVTYNDVEFYIVNAVSFTSKENAVADFTFLRSSGKFFLFAISVCNLNFSLKLNFVLTR